MSVRGELAYLKELLSSSETNSRRSDRTDPYENEGGSGEKTLVDVDRQWFELGNSRQSESDHFENDSRSSD